jgi:hypothetical protein
MAYNKALPFAVPPHIAVAGLLCLAWILHGLIGHDPWKPDEAYSFGLVYHILQGGDWVVPTLAGEPFMEKPPLFYLSAALFAWMLSPLLPLHEGAMLTSGFYMALTFLFVGLGGRELYGRESGLIAPLILLGCIGLLIRTHQLITDVSMLAGFAIGLYGLALSLRRPVLAGLWLGAGVGIGFMSKGLIVPGVLGVVSLLLPVLFKCWRNRGYAVCLLVALVAATPWLTIWPFALYQRSPALFVEWFWLNNLGSFLGHVVLAGTGKKGYLPQASPLVRMARTALGILGALEEQGRYLRCAGRPITARRIPGDAARFKPCGKRPGIVRPAHVVAALVACHCVAGNAPRRRSQSTELAGHCGFRIDRDVAVARLDGADDQSSVRDCGVPGESPTRFQRRIRRPNLCNRTDVHRAVVCDSMP